MKNIKLLLTVLIGLGSFGYAGGDIIPVTPYEIEDDVLATESAVEVEEFNPIVEEYTVIPAVDPKVVTEHGKSDSNILTEHGRSDTSTVTEHGLSEPKRVTSQPTAIGSGFYIGLGITAAKYDTNCKCSNKKLSGTDGTGGVIAKIGYTVNEYIGIEARGLKTMIDSDGGEITHLSVLVKPSVPLGESVSLYGLVGWGTTETSGELRKTDVDGLSWGAGLSYDVGDNISISADYERLFQESDSPDLDSVNIGVNYGF